MKFRVATYNTLGFTADAPNDADRRKIAIVDALIAEQVDIACLQEIKTIWPTNNDPGHNSEQYFRKKSDYNDGTFIVYADQRKKSKNGEGIMTRLPVIEKNAHFLPYNLFGRACVRVTVEIGSHRLHVLTTHLAPPAIGRMIAQYGATTEGQNAARRRQLDAMEDIISGLDDGYPLVIGGDFNVDDTSEDFANWRERLKLVEVYPDTVQNPRKTFATHPSPSFDCGLEYRYDHLLYKSGTQASLSLNGSGTIFGAPVEAPSAFFYGFLSDHCGLYGEFEISAIK